MRVFVINEPFVNFIFLYVPDYFILISPIKDCANRILQIIASLVKIDLSCYLFSNIYCVL